MIYSPSSLRMFSEDRSNFYLTYIAKNRPPRSPQTMPMGLGSYFDCRVKDQIQLDVLKQPSLFSSEMLSSVEIPIRDEIAPHGERVWDMYKSVGAWKWLKKLLRKVTDITTEEMISAKVGAVELRGIPDLIFKVEGKWVIFDWKVNGYFSMSNVGPHKYYSKLLEVAGKNKMHRQSMITNPVLLLNGMHTMDECNEGWSTQLATYAMIMGIEEDFIAMIDQLTFVNGSAGKELRCGQFRMKITQDYMEDVYNKYELMDSVVKSGHIFTDMTRQQSNERCEELEDVGFALLDSGDPSLLKYMQRHCR